MVSHSPIARKLTILIVLFSTAITILTTAVQLLFDYHKEIDDLDKQIENVKTAQVESLSRAVWTFDDQGIQIIIENILKSTDIEYSRVSVDTTHSWSGGSRASHNTRQLFIPVQYNHLGENVEIATLEIVASLDTVYSRLIRKAAIIFIGNGVKTFCVSLFILFLFQRLVTQHLIDLASHATQVAANIAKGPFVLRREKSRDDELDRAADAINLMRSNLLDEMSKIKEANIERERLQEQLIQAQKMESVGRLAGGVAHDFNNMLGIILGHIELALDNPDTPEPLKENLAEIEKAATRSASLTRQLLAFARNQPITPQKLDLNEVVSNMLNMLKRLIGEEVVLIWEPGPSLMSIYMDPTQIDQILANLCVNSRDAISGAGKIHIATDMASADKSDDFQGDEPLPGDYVRLIVSDNGSGMDQETQKYLFEPFYSTKSIGEGTGLGMSTVYGIVKQNNGFIDVCSEPGQGTTIKIYLPCFWGEGSKELLQTPFDEELKGQETLLLVEDDPDLLRVARTILERLGYNVLPADTPGKAIEIAEECQGKLDLVITDVIMPKMNGKELCQRILEQWPGIPVLFVSGYTADIISDHGVLDEHVHFIEKPFTKYELGKKVREVLNEKV